MQKTERPRVRRRADKFFPFNFFLVLYYNKKIIKDLKKIDLSQFKVYKKITTNKILNA